MCLFEQPVFSPVQLLRRAEMPSKQMIMSLLGRLRDAGILTVTRAASGRRPQILAFAELVNLCEGHEVFPTPRARRGVKVRVKAGARPEVRNRAR